MVAIADLTHPLSNNRSSIRIIGCLVTIWSVFWQMDDPESSSCRRGTGKSFTPYVLRPVAGSLQPGWFENIMPSTTARGHLSYGVNGCQGTAWSGELDGKELHGVLVGECDLEPRGSTVSWTSLTWSQPIFQHPLQVWYYVDFKGGA